MTITLDVYVLVLALDAHLNATDVIATPC